MKGGRDGRRYRSNSWGCLVLSASCLGDAPKPSTTHQGLRTKHQGLVEIEVPGGFGDGLVVRLLECFLEALRQRVAARPLGRHRLVEGGVAPLLLLGQNLLCV